MGLCPLGKSVGFYFEKIKWKEGREEGVLLGIGQLSLSPRRYKRLIVVMLIT